MRETFTVFFFEDDESTAKRLKRALEQPPDNPDAPLLAVHHYLRAKDAFAALERLTEPPDVALLDRHQSDYTNAGLDLCERIKTDWPNVPVVFLSEHDGLGQQGDGLDVGAISYLSKALFDKPDHEEFIRKVLLAAIRETEGLDGGPPKKYQLGSLEIDMNMPQVCWRGQVVELTQAQRGILDELARPGHTERLCKYSDLATAGGITGNDRDQRRENVKQHIQKIRRAFEKVDEDFRAACLDRRYGIVAIPKAGYRWVSNPVSETA